MSTRPQTTPQVVVGGRWLSSLAPWGDLVITDRWPYGCWALEWQVALKPYQRLPGVLVAGAPVEARMGSGVRWSGILAEPDWDSGTMSAVGLARQGETTLCLTNTGAVSSTPDTVIDRGINDGALSWLRRASISGAAFAAGETQSLNYVTALMDAWSSANGKRWGVNAAREVYAAADPTAPSIYMRPGSGVLGVTEETLAARVFGRYINLGGAYDTVSVGAGTPEVGVGLFEDYGPMDATAATNILTGIRNQLQARTGWTNGITVTADMITTPGGTPMGLDQITAGQMARLLGLRDERGASASTDIVIGETVWNVSNGTVQVNPVGLSDRSLSGVIEAAGGTLL